MRHHLAPSRVFVYGTLLRGETNHHFLRRARFLGRFTTRPSFALYSTGPYPVLCPGGRFAVSGEVYAISGLTLQALDRLEGYPEEYDRMLIPTRWGLAWVYYQGRPPGIGRLLPTGSWRERR